MTKQQKLRATMVRSFRRLASVKRRPSRKSRMGFYMHPAVYHFLYYGFRHDDCVWWNKFNRVS